jgi:DNA-binding transcriptional ArsR family regulator
VIQDQRQLSDGADPTFDPDEQSGNALLRALGDPKSRAILRTTSERARTASELSEELDLPLSTLYRKLNRLVDATIVEETPRLASRGRHPSQYRCAIEQVHIRMSEDEEEFVDVDVSPEPEQNRILRH